MISLFVTTPNRLHVVGYVAHRFKCCSSEHNLHLYTLLSDMPKLAKHTAALKQQRQKLKEKSQKYTPGIVTLQVLGSGANGAPRSLYVFTDQSRYMFNCGEGTQRLAHEHKMKLAKLEHIFFTYGSWENIGGLPGVSLTIQDVGVPEITVHGPQGIVDIFSATRRFIILKDLAVKTADYNEYPYFEDNVMRIKYVPLRIPGEHVTSRRTTVSLDRKNKRGSYSCTSDTDEESYCTTDDETDYYAHERGGAVLQKVDKKKKKKRRNKRSASVSAAHSGDVEEICSKRRRLAESVCNVAISYICKLHPRPGALNLEACVERGVPPGPLLGRLKAGEDVKLADGHVIKSADVTSPDDPGPVFIVVECPDERFLDPLEKDDNFTPYQCQEASAEDGAFLVVHFTPPHIVKNPRYKRWMAKFPFFTRHLMINEANHCMGSVAVHRIQQKLHLLHPKIFPLLSDSDIPTVNSVKPLNEITSNGNDDKCDADGLLCSSSSLHPTSSPVYYAKTFTVVQLRPHKLIDSSNELTLNTDEYKNEVLEVNSMVEVLDGLRKCQLFKQESAAEQEEYPSVVFLGTGSCIPNKTRNTSGILLNISEDLCMLLDCGEGTYGQLVRFHGRNNIAKILSSMRGIFISHLHADHHIGLIGILKARHRYTNNSNSPIFLMAPKQIMTWLKYYNDNFEPILQQVQLVPNSDMVHGSELISKDAMKSMCDSLDLSNISTAPVKHCPNSFGVAIRHKSGWKITYSGDTMPCESLVELGKDCDVLIHEATMEDELEHEARIKMHSTTSQAIEIGKKMNARFTLLTHFSQRYATLPRFNDNIKEGVGIAFDNMKVSLSDVNKLPLLYPALQLMFSAHQDELEQKAYRRQMKQLRMTGNSTSVTEH